MARKLTSVPVNFESALEQHLLALQVKGYSEYTVRNRRVHIRFFVRWCRRMKIAGPHRVTSRVLKQYQQHVFEYRKKCGGALSVSSQFARLVPLRVWFRWMKRERMIRFDPSADIELPRLIRTLPHVVLSAREAIQILKQPDTRTSVGLRDRAILELLYSSALRRLEIIRLSVSDVQIDRRMILVRSGKHHRDRYVPVSPRASRWLLRYVRQSRAKLAALGETALFVSREGCALSRDHLTQLARKYVSQADIGKTGACHLFRHTVATLMHENGADIRFVQQLLGHADIRTTQIYTQVAIRKLQEVHSATHPAW